MQTIYKKVVSVDLRPERELTRFGGHGVDRQLRHRGNTPSVYWSVEHANSYVAVWRGPVGEGEGQYELLSINGIGEIRWSLNPWSAFGEGDSAKEEAMAYFFDRKIKVFDCDPF